MSDAFVIKGLVREEDSGIGLPDLIVRAYDKDLKYDDLMGEARTGCDGSFCIASRAEDFRDLFDKRPDIYLRVLVPAPAGMAPREVWNTRHAVRWNASRLEYIVVELPHAVCQGLPHGEHGGGHAPSKEGCDHQSHKPCPTTPITRCRDIYLRIEKLRAYSPVAPDDAEHDRYRRDCMRNDIHEDTRIPETEVERRRLDALVYREYLDPGYTVLKTDPLVPADINEPPAGRRIPGAVIYAEPGERLFVHICNADDEPHSLHVHGLIYGIDSDGSWPFGVRDANGRRSDAICPGQTWCYAFDVTEETIGAWPFHDHHRHITEAVDRGLFGGIVVRDPRCPKPDYEVPLFFHRLVPERGEALFDSGSLEPGETFAHTFMAEGTYDYQCRFHPMSGVVRVTAMGPLAANVNILDGPGRFDPADVTIGLGGTVTWTHAGTEPHTVTDTGGAGLPSPAFNGRTFVGNTPTIVARSGKRIRWYLFNLDLSAQWHNFHVHGQRWRLGEEIIDTRSLGPAESFVADTIVPPVILLPLKDCAAHKEQRRDEDCGCGERLGRKRLQLPMRPGLRGLVAGHGGMAMPGAAAPMPSPAGHRRPRLEASHQGGPSHSGKQRCVRLSGDFLVHCHVEMHIMEGMAAVVRAVQDVELSPEVEAALGFEVPLAAADTCPDVAFPPCVRAGGGTWERLPDPPIFVVHAAVLHTGTVLLWSGGAEAGYPLTRWSGIRPTPRT